MKRFAAALSLLCTISTAHAQDSGWRDASVADVERGEDMRFRLDSPSLYLSAVGDFDGDGVQDIARLQVNDARRVHALLITDGRGQHRLAEGRLSYLPRTGVALRERGSLSSAWEPAALFLRADGIDLIVFESADVLYYACDRGYCRYQISD
ncbi:MAG: hypothetical protein ABL889_13330 [Terricaulis sp.]